MLQTSRIRWGLRYLGIGVATLVLLGGVFTLAIYFIVFSGREHIPEVVREMVREQTGAEIRFERYRIQVLRHSSLVAVALNEVRLRDSLADSTQEDLLYVRELALQFHPLKLLQRHFEVTSLLLNGGRLRMIRTADGIFNAAFLSRRKPAPARDSSDLRFSIDRIQVKNVEVDFADSLQGKFHRVTLSNSLLRRYQEDTSSVFRITGQWQIHGLTFRRENGSFLTEKKAAVDLSLERSHRKSGIRLLHSRAVIDNHIFYLSGFLDPGEPAYLKLTVAVDKLRLEEARQLLAANLRRNLGAYQVDGPISTRLLLEGPLINGRPLPAEVQFSLHDARLSTGDWSFSGVTLDGRFYQCDSTALVDPHSGCLDIDRFRGRLYGVIPVEGTARVRDLTAPAIQWEGIASADLADLREVLPAGLIQSPAGKARLHARYEGTLDGLTNPRQKGKTRLAGRLSLQDVSMIYLPEDLPLRQIQGEFPFDEQDMQIEDLALVAGSDSLRVQGRLHRLIPALFTSDRRLHASLSVTAPQLNIDRLTSRPRDTPSPPSDSGVAASPGDRIGAIIEGLLNHVDLDLALRAGRLRYRKFSAGDLLFQGRFRKDCPDLQREGCLLVDTFTATLYDALRLQATARISHLADPQIDLHGELGMRLPLLNRLMSDGQLYFQKGQADLRFYYTGKLNDYVDPATGRLNGRLEGELCFDDMRAEVRPRQYQVEGGSGAFHFDNRNLLIDTLRLQLNGNDLQAAGSIINFIPFIFTRNRPLAVRLRVRTPQLDFSQFTGSLAGKALPGIAHSSRSNPFSEVIRAAFQRLEADLSVEADRVSYRRFKAREVAFSCRYAMPCPPVPGVPRQHLGKPGFVFDHFQAQLFGGVPLQASLSVHDIDHPFFVVDARVAMPLVRLNEMLPSRRLMMRGGRIDMGFHYEGYFQPPGDTTGGRPAPVLNGQGVIDSAALDVVSRGYRFRDMQVGFAFDQEDLMVKRLEGLLNDNSLEVSGAFQSFLPFLYAPDQKLEVVLDVRSPELDFNRFSAPSRIEAGTEEDIRVPTPVTKIVEAALSNVEADLAVRLDKVRYRKFSASNISGNLSMAPDSLTFRRAVMDLAGGQFRIQGDITGLVENAPRINVQVGMRDADVRRIFFAFDNFGQDRLTFDNLQGKLTADIAFQARADANYDLDPGSIYSHIDLKVVDGALVRLPALMQMNKFVFKNRDMANVRFATLENTFEVRGQQLFIERFDVHSSALTFGVEGRLSFGSHDSTDLLFKVPVSNLFRQDLSEEALDNREDRPLGLSILLRATERDGRLRLRWVLARPRD